MKEVSGKMGVEAEQEDRHCCHGNK